MSAANPDEVSGAGTSVRVLCCGRFSTSSVSRLAGDAVCHLPLEGKAYANLTARDMVALGFPLLLPTRVTASFRVVPFAGAVSIRPE